MDDIDNYDDSSNIGPILGIIFFFIIIIFLMLLIWNRNDNTCPDPPLNPIALADGKLITVDWIASNTPVDGYYVYLGDSPNFDINNDEVKRTQTTATTTTITAPSNDTYYVKVQAYKEQCFSKAVPSPGIIIQTNIICPFLDKPTYVMVTKPNNNYILNWNVPNTVVSGYNIYMDTTNNFTISPSNYIANVRGTNITNFTIPSIYCLNQTINCTYYVAVASVLITNGTACYSLPTYGNGALTFSNQMI